MFKISNGTSTVTCSLKSYVSTTTTSSYTEFLDGSTGNTLVNTSSKIFKTQNKEQKDWKNVEKRIKKFINSVKPKLFDFIEAQDSGEKNILGLFAEEIDENIKGE